MDIAPKYVLITNPGHDYAAAFVQAIARRPGLRPIALFTLEWRYQRYLTSFTSLAPAFDRVIRVFDADAAGIVDEVERALGDDLPRLEAIIPWDDSSGILAGHLSERFDLGWNSIAVTTRFRDKAVMREHLRQFDDVPRVESRATDRLDEALSFQRELGRWPVVLKPTDAGSCWNLTFARSEQELRAGFTRILGGKNEFDNTISRRVQLEEFVSGIEYAVNGQTDRHGKVLITDVFRYVRSPIDGFENFVSTAEYLQPDTELVAELGRAAARIVTRAGLRSSPFHGELRISEGGPRLIEIQARLAGHLAGLVREAVYPELVELALAGYLGELEFEAPFAIYQPERPVHASLVVGACERAGVLEAVVGAEQVERLDSFVGYSLRPEVGDRLELTRDHDHMLYAVFLAHRDPDALQRDAGELRETLKFVIS